MKYFEWGELGGFPLTQDALDWMQAGFMEPLAELCKSAGDHVIISGMEKTETPVPSSTDRDVAIAAGWCYMGGHIFRFTGDSDIFTAAEQPRLLGVANATNLTFQNATVQGVKLENEAQLVHTGGVLYSDFRRINEGWGEKSRGAWVTLTDTSDALVMYRVDKATGMCHVRGECRHYSNNYASSGTFIPMQMGLAAGTLPSPVGGNFYFRTSLETHTVPMLRMDDGTGGSGGVYLGDVGRVSLGGSISISSRLLMGTVPSGRIHKFGFSYPVA